MNTLPDHEIVLRRDVFAARCIRLIENVVTFLLQIEQHIRVRIDYVPSLQSKLTHKSSNHGSRVDHSHAGQRNCLVILGRTSVVPVVTVSRRGQQSKTLGLRQPGLVSQLVGGKGSHIRWELIVPVGFEQAHHGKRRSLALQLMKLGIEEANHQLGRLFHAFCTVDHIAQRRSAVGHGR